MFGLHAPEEKLVSWAISSPGWENRSASQQSVTHGPWGAWLRSGPGKFAGPVKSINFFTAQEVLIRSGWIRLGKPGGSRGSEDLQQQPGGLHGSPGEILLQSVRKTMRWNSWKSGPDVLPRNLKRWQEQRWKMALLLGRYNPKYKIHEPATTLTSELTYSTLIYQHI